MPSTTTLILRRAPSGGLSDGKSSYRGGQFIPEALWQAERKKAEDALPPLITDLDENLQFLRGLYEQNATLFAWDDKEAATGNAGALKGILGKVPALPLTTIEARMKAALRVAYSRAYLLGRRAGGNLLSAPVGEGKEIERMVKEEYAYLRGFLADMKEGTGRVPYPARAAMYARAVRESYWRGFVMATEKGGADKRRVYWKRGRTEQSCVDCKRYAAHTGGWTIAEFIRDVMPHLPGAGSLSCHGIQCDCRLQETP